MERTKWVAGCAALAVFGGLLGTPSMGQAGLGGALKKKLDKATKQVQDQADQAGEKARGDASDRPADKAGGEGGAAGAAGAAGQAGGAAPGGAGGGGGSINSVSTKFDYVPGDSVLFSDDLTQDELGEFPARWTLKSGTFEVAERAGERWLRCTSTNGAVRMKVPAGLPEFWTLEFDFDCADLGGAIALTVDGLTAGGEPAWESRFPYSGHNYEIHAGDVTAQTPIDGDRVAGRHHFMYMARGTALKAYVDRQRVASLPDVTARGAATQFDLILGAPGGPMITNVRFAEGCRPAQDALDRGKLVTYGIRFATGSDEVLPESAPVLRQVSAWMDQHAQARLRITGHTDNVGAPASNLDLSRRRAAAVARALSAQFGVPAERLATEGRGDTQPVAGNGRPEGRAMNRRVEFARL